MSSPLPVPVLEQQSPASRLFGYARVSIDDQDLSLQTDALQQHGIPKTANRYRSTARSILLQRFPLISPAAFA